MRKFTIGILAGAAAWALSHRANATPIYLQNFSATAGMTPIGAVNWSAYYGSATTPATVATAGSSGVPANAMISGGPSAPTAGPNVNATQITSSTADGFVPLLSSDGADQFVVSSNASEYAINTSFSVPTSIIFSWYAASGYAGDQQRLIVQIGGNWYASTSPVSPPSGVIQGTSFQAGSQQFTTTFTNAASAWETLNFSPGSDLTLGPVLTSPLPSGNINQFGIYADIANNNKGNERTFFDSFEVDAVPSPVPEPTGVVIFVAAAVCLRRRRKVVL